MEQRKIYQYALGKVLNKKVSFYGWNSKFYGHNVYINNEKITLTEEQANAWKQLKREDVENELLQNRIALNISYDEYKKFSNEDINTLKDLGHFDSVEKSWFADNEKNHEVLEKLSEKYREAKDQLVGYTFGEKGDYAGEMMIMEKTNGERYTVTL
jgi:hypothetical protein